MIDKVSTWIGQAFSWLILGLALMISWEVFSRYVLSNPHAWAFDVMLMCYGTMFMMAGAYTLSKNGHVRGDVLYGFFPPRLQASLERLREGGRGKDSEGEDEEGSHEGLHGSFSRRGTTTAGTAQSGRADAPVAS